MAPDTAATPSGPYTGASVPVGNPLEPAPSATAELQPDAMLLLSATEIADLAVVLRVVRHCAEWHESPTAQDVDESVARLALALRSVPNG